MKNKGYRDPCTHTVCSAKSGDIFRSLQIPAISEAVIGGVEAKAESWMAHPPSWSPFQLWEATINGHVLKNMIFCVSKSGALSLPIKYFDLSLSLCFRHHWLWKFDYPPVITEIYSKSIPFTRYPSSKLWPCFITFVMCLEKSSKSIIIWNRQIGRLNEQT
jgi:hypothetical protein